MVGDCCSGTEAQGRSAGSEERGWAGSAVEWPGALGAGGTSRCAEAVSAVAKGHSRSARGQPVRGNTGRACTPLAGSGPALTPDLIRLSPLGGRSCAKLPSREGTGDSCYRSPVPRVPHQSPREDELEVNLRTM
ncbi:hypothetical protein GCM10010508_07500 [Streptomyces naganishii JCM 4654]|uniref:Uncharacterized protein n=1 Tax=Streptomyces naganishii JCM 4654 TaxID=1306179 RepID=A0A919CUT5_9ACTN|nr:hypothetical protein GCM10010508_07500 [Streptomyces naganishii JCM 4654]